MSENCCNTDQTKYKAAKLALKAKRLLQKLLLLTVSFVIFISDRTNHHLPEDLSETALFTHSKHKVSRGVEVEKIS